ncbi:Cysteine-rich receptor-like protein kinase 1 [Linum perenne]
MKMATEHDDDDSVFSSLTSPRYCPNRSNTIHSQDYCLQLLLLLWRYTLQFQHQLLNFLIFYFINHLLLHYLFFFIPDLLQLVVFFAQSPFLLPPPQEEGNRLTPPQEEGNRLPPLQEGRNRLTPDPPQEDNRLQPLQEGTRLPPHQEGNRIPQHQEGGNRLTPLQEGGNWLPPLQEGNRLPPHLPPQEGNRLQPLQEGNRPPPSQEVNRLPMAVVPSQEENDDYPSNDSVFRSLTYPRYCPRLRPTDQTRNIQATPRTTVINYYYSSAATPANSDISCSISSSSISTTSFSFTVISSSSSSLSRASLNLSSCSLNLRSNYRCIVRGREAIGFRRPNNIISPDKLIRHLSTISTLRHANVVQIIQASGSEINEPYSTVDLVYQFVDGPTLSDCLNPGTAVSSSNEIALGVARGLAYIHHMTGSDVVFVHNRIKSSNIIISGDSKLFTPMICNFGLSRAGWHALDDEDDENHEYGIPNVTEDEEGYAYMAPELVEQGEIAATHKSDVYAFGVLLLELLFGRTISKNFQTSIRQSAKLAFADEFGKVGPKLLGVDTRLNYESLVNEVLCVGLACVVKDPALRPDMAFVEGIISQSVAKFENEFSNLG